MIEEKYKVSVSKSETEYFAMLLQSLKQEDKIAKNSNSCSYAW